MTTAIIGSLGEFNPDNETMTAYLERVDLYFLANGIADDKQVPAFLSIVGRETYGLLSDLFAPEKPADQTLENLKAKLKGHYEPLKVPIAERYNFHLRSQQPGETIAEFLADLRKLSIHCEFGDYLTQALRDRLVCGLRSDAMKKRLLSEKTLTLQSAVQISQSLEAAEKNTQLLKGTASGTDTSIHKVEPHPEDRDTGTAAEIRCYRCGNRNHKANECRFKQAVCHNCGKRGHIARVCRSTPERWQRRPREERRTKWMQMDKPQQEYSDSDSDISILAVGAEKKHHPITVTVLVDGKELPFELDTGAAVSIISEQTQKRTFPDASLKRTPLLLRTYTGEQMAVLGEMTVEVRYGEKQCYSLPLLVVAGSGPSLLGRDWLHDIKLDWKSIGLTTLDRGQARVQALLQQYQEIFSEELGTIRHFKARLQLKEGAKPVFCKPRPVPFALREAIKQELDRLETAGIVEKVAYSDWAAPIVPVPKGDGKMRLCGDYKVTINPHLEIDQYPFPKLDDLFASLTGGKQFSKLDLSQAYQQLPLEEDSQPLVTINTHQGLYRYKRLPFGIASAPAIFQRTMDTVLQGIPYVQCYIDDILITGTSEEEHLQNLEQVLDRLQQNGIRVKRNKCVFFQNSVEYLGHQIDAEGLHTTTKKIEAVQKVQKPQNKKQLRSFLGLMQYYSKFIPNLATLLHPLNQLMCQDTRWKWTEECERVFNEAKQNLTSSRVLVHYDPELPLRLAADASAYGIGAVISHVLPNGMERPIAFASRTLTTSEQNYAQLEKEALSLIFGVRKFHQYLYGRKFTLYTDHKPLLVILGPKKGVSPLAAARLQRWALLLSEYSYDIEYKRTQDHGNADGLSRLPQAIATHSHSNSSSSVCPSQNLSEVDVFAIRQIEALPLTSNQLQQATRNDPVLSRVLRFTERGWPTSCPEEVLKPFHTRRNELTIIHGCVLWGSRVLVPKKLRDQVLEELHQSHPGIARMKSLARSYVWWPKLDQDIETLSKQCRHCQSEQASPQTAPLHPWSWPSRPWQRIHVDFAGPMQTRNFLIVVDAHSKWADVIPMKSTTSIATIQELRRLFAMFGLPEQLVSDNGPQFTSDEFESFLKSNRIKHICSAPYHPSSNGAAERFIRTFKKSMRNANNPKYTFHQQLMNFLISYRTTPHATTGVTPVSLFLLRSIRTRLDLLHPDTEKTVQQQQSKQKLYHDQHSKERHFYLGQRVLARNYRSGPKWVTGTITKKLGPLLYQVTVAGDRVWRRHVEQLLVSTDSPHDLSSPDSDSTLDSCPTLTSPLLPQQPVPAPVSSTPDEDSESVIVDQSSAPTGVRRETLPQPMSQSVAVSPPSRRYPQRSRKQPDYYHDTYMHT